MRDLRLAIRSLARTPFLTTVAVLSLALGIGANGAIFSLFDQILLKPLPVEEPDRLVNLAAPGPKPGSQSCGDAGGCDEVFSYPMFRDLQGEQGSFVGMAAHVGFGANLAVQNQTMKGQGMLVSGSYFPTLGLRPALGRLLTPEEDRTPGEHPVAVLSHRFWESRLGSDPGLLGETVIVNGHPMTVIGVAPDGFDGTTFGAQPDVFVPLTMRGAVQPGFDPGFENRRYYWAYVFARLNPEVTLPQALAELNTLYRGIIESVEAPLQEGMSDQTMARFLDKELILTEGFQGQSSLHEDSRTPLIFLLSVTGLVLIIACANIANLLLARGANRSQEMAIRSSLGARRSHLFGQLLTESLVLAVLGGVASLVVAWATLRGMQALMPPQIGAVIQTELRPAVLGFIGALALGTGVLFGLYPALHSTRADLVTVLKGSSGQPSGARSASRFRTVLVTSQIALSMALLVAAGLFVRSLLNVSRVDLGLEADRVVTFAVSPELNGYEPEESQAFFRRVEEELAAIPGVTGVTAALVPLLAGSSWGTDVSVEGFEWGPDVDDNSRYNVVGPGYFRTLGMPLVAGRDFTAGDGPDALKVAVINETFAEKFGLDRTEAVGKWMSLSSGSGAELDRQIVGVVEDAKYADVKQEVPPLFFIPYRAQNDVGRLNFYVRTGVDPVHVMRAIPPALQGLDPNLPVENLKTLDTQVRENVFVDRMISMLSAAFAALATLLAAIGLYGVLAYSVAQRTREIGLRMALGARGNEVRRMILRQVGVMTLVGGVAGIGGAVVLGRTARSLLFEMGAQDPLVIGAGAALLAAVAMVAGYLPSARASRVDPMEALRYE